MIILKACPFCQSPARWCGENEPNPEDNHLCHQIVCTNPACAAQFDFNTDNEEVLPDNIDDLSAEQCMELLRVEMAKRYNKR